MTVTNEPTTTPEVPAWLNLDGIISLDLSLRVEESRDAMKDLIEGLHDTAARYQVVCRTSRRR